MSIVRSLLGASRSRSIQPVARANDGVLFDIARLAEGDRQRNEAAIRHLCRTVPMSDGVVLCRVLGKYKLLLDAGDWGLSPHLMLDGFWEMWVTSAMARVVKKGMRAIDIGANLGYYTVLLCDLCGESGFVDAFEPNPDMLARLRISLDLNGFGSNARVWDCPLSDVDGDELALSFTPGEPKNARVVPRSVLADHPGLRGFPVTTRTLDVLPEITTVDFIKIDAEGAEEKIWNGMGALLARNRDLTIFLEFTADCYASPRAFLGTMTSCGFALAYIDPQRGIAPISEDRILSDRPASEDWMLMLTRGSAPVLDDQANRLGVRQRRPVDRLAAT